jgi:hypothetical protein
MPGVGIGASGALKISSRAPSMSRSEISVQEQTIIVGFLSAHFL